MNKYILYIVYLESLFHQSAFQRNICFMNYELSCDMISYNIIKHFYLFIYVILVLS